MEYKEKFELLLGQPQGIPEAVLEGNFMKGLKPEIRASLRLLRPRGLGETMELAQMIEDKNTAEQVNRSNSEFFIPKQHTFGGIENLDLGVSARVPKHTTERPENANNGVTRDSQRDRVSGARLGVTFKRLTETEIQDKRTKGLCFRCDEKFSLGHQCKDKSLHVLTVCDEEQGGEEAKEVEPAVS